MLSRMASCCCCCCCGIFMMISMRIIKDADDRDRKCKGRTFVNFEHCHVAKGSFHPYIVKRRSEWPIGCEQGWVWPIRVPDAHISRRMDCLDYHLWWIQEAGEGVAWFRQKHPPRSWPGRLCSHWQGNKEWGNKIWGLLSDLGGATST